MWRGTQIIKLLIRLQVETSRNRGFVDSRCRRFQSDSGGKECSFCRYRVVQKVWNFSRKRRTIQNFIFCWPCISSKILANNQLDKLFHVFIYLLIYFISLHVSSIQCSSSGDRIVLMLHLVWLVCVSDCLVCRYWHTKQSHRLIIPDDILIQFDLLMMSTWCSKHVERWNK